LKSAKCAAEIGHAGPSRIGLKSSKIGGETCVDAVVTERPKAGGLGSSLVGECRRGLWQRYPKKRV